MSNATPWFRRTDLLLVLLALAGLALHVLNEDRMFYRRLPYYEKKVSAARRAARCFDAIRLRHLGYLPETNDEMYVDQSGLIGKSITQITTDDGRLEAKQTSVNPNWAAVLVGWFHELRLKPGDPIAVGMTGSFPALNIAVLTAIEEMELRPIVITSVGPSSWGATDPNFTWIDMEHFLNEQGLLKTRSVAASMGGRYDRGAPTDPGKELLRKAIERSGIRPIVERTRNASIRTRMAIYDSLAGNTGVKAFVNVGGGVASVGTREDRKHVQPGVNWSLKNQEWRVRGVLQRFSERGLPVVHLANVRELARRYDLPETPGLVQPVGWGGIYGAEVYDLRIAYPSLALYLVLCFVVLWSRHRAARAVAREAAAPPPQKVANEVAGGHGGDR